MRRLTRRILIIVLFCLPFGFASWAQSVIDPTDPVVEYDPANPPARWDDFTNPLVKWVRTLNIENGAVQDRNNGWNGNEYKAYNYRGLAFRVEFPSSYVPDANDGKKYPLIIFLHGQGENDNTYLAPDPNYDNQFQLLQGPPQFDKAIKDGTYDGYVLAPQLQNGPSGATPYYSGTLETIMKIVDYMILHNKVDPFRIIVNGLSEGGVAVWDMLDFFPTRIAAGIPMSAPVAFVDWQKSNYFNTKRYKPIWIAQGGLDEHPTPAETQRIKDSMDKYGANFREMFYENSHHDTWYQTWDEPHFWPFVNKAYASNPWPRFGKDHFWPGESVDVTIGLTGEFTGYEWRRNGQLIVGSNSNEIHVTDEGVYDARVKLNGEWSDWSLVPVTVTKSDSYRIEAEDWVNSSGAQTEITSDVDGNLNVGWLANGDWMDYSIRTVSGYYQLDLRLASAARSASPGKIQVVGNDNTLLAEVDIPPTDGWQTWETIPVFVHLPSGYQNIRLKIVSSSTDDVVNVNWLKFTLASADASLPVKFVYFNAQCNNQTVNVRWKTAQEQNSSSFTVQRTTDGNNWTDIGSVPAAGQSSTERSYAFVDRSAPGTAYYRVVEKDADGRTSITSTVKSICGGGTQISVYPNPSSGNSSLNISLDQATNLALKVLDAKGAVMQQRQLQLPAGSTTIPLDMSSWPDGVYTINAQYNSQVKTMKIIKQ